VYIITYLILFRLFTFFAGVPNPIPTYTLPAEDKFVVGDPGATGPITGTYGIFATSCYTYDVSSIRAS
jgi:hypothetical protein